MRLGWVLAGVMGLIPASAMAQDRPARGARDASGPARSLPHPLPRITSPGAVIRLAAGMGDARHGLLRDATLSKPFALPASWAVRMRGVLPVSVIGAWPSHLGPGGIAVPAFPVTPPRGALHAGVGPALPLPTADPPGPGSRHWGGGPAVAMGHPADGITAGSPLSQRWSLAGPSAGSRNHVSLLPALFSLGLGEGWSSDLGGVTDHDGDGHDRQRWMVPVSLSRPGAFPFGTARAMHHAMPGGPQRAVGEFGLNQAVLVPNGYRLR